MTTLFINKNGVFNRLRDVNAKNISLNSAFTIEYEHIKIVSNKFDLLGKSELAIINNIRSTLTKEISPDNLVYYDSNCRTKKIKNRFMYRYTNIKDFNPSNYGNKIFYYTPSYSGDDINICTNFYEIDNIVFFSKISNLLTSASNYTNYGMYFNLAGQIIKGIGDIYNRLNYKKELVTPHVLEFDSEHIYEGLYVCFPEIENEIEEQYIIDHFIYQNDSIINTKINKAYENSFFILKIEEGRKDSFLDFNFLTDATVMLQKLNQKDEDTINQYINNNKNSYDLTQLKAIIQKNSAGLDFKNEYNKLNTSMQEWVDKFIK